MQKRNTKERRQMILQALDEFGKVSVEDLAGTHETSEVTIRKDLRALEDAGLAIRNYGGAISLRSELHSTNEITKRKLAIASLATKLIKDHNRIIIDSGTTTRAMIPAMVKVQGLVVMTNSLGVAEQLRELENEPTLLMTGGTWDKRSESFQGKVAKLMLKEYNFDQLFIGADGFDVERGTTTFNEFTDLSVAMAESAREVIVLAESYKFERRIPNMELAWSQVDYLITDNDLEPEQRKLIESKGVNVLSAENIE